jgi:hypothetical protein
MGMSGISEGAELSGDRVPNLLHLGTLLDEAETGVLGYNTFAIQDRARWCRQWRDQAAHRNRRFQGVIIRLVGAIQRGQGSGGGSESTRHPSSGPQQATSLTTRGSVDAIL